MLDAPAPAVGPPVLEASHIVFKLADPGQRYQRVRLYQEVTRPRDGVEASWADGIWTATMTRPDQPPTTALRVEYAFIVDHADGGQEFLVDPANPLQAPGAFGAKSVIELPDYRRPAWLAQPAADPGTTTWTQLPLPRFGAAMPCGIWQPAGVTSTEPLPLLIVHDGPEYADYSRLTDLLAHAVAADRIPPTRAALLGPVPGRRDETYSASAHYADGLAFTALPWLARTAPQPDGIRPTVMGASLGGLASLHVAHRHPSSFGNLFLQSGSFFRQRTDGHERGFAHFDRVTRFVGRILSLPATHRPRRITLTCGLVEENLANNRVLTDALDRAGHDVTLATTPDGHTYTAWRDALDPHLIDLLAV